VRLLREPLLHFLLLGFAIHVAASHFDRDSGRYRIDAGAAQRARLAELYRQQYGAPPSRAELEQLVEQYVRNEILYREGLAMGLADDDEIVRRRVVQKIEFVNEDLDDEPAADPAELARYFAQNRLRYTVDATVSFEQVFFSTDRPGDPRTRAAAALHSGERGEGGGGAGDAFSAGNRFELMTRTRANTVFGDSDLSAELFVAPVGEWSGPFKSSYGWHLIRIVRRQPPRAAELAEVSSRVEADYRAQRRDRANRLAYQRIARKYRIVTGGPAA
jgi:peptidyl-prolyl cis-trans isomerase C